MKKLTLLAGALLAGNSVVASGQTVDETVAYRAIGGTPVGSLPPILTNTLLNRLQNGGSLAFRYGHLGSGPSNFATHAFGVTGILPAGLGSSISLTAGLIRQDCNGCEVEAMLGAGGDLRLTGMSMGTSSTSPLFTVSLNGEFGWGNRDPGSFMSGYVGLPIALVQRGEGMQFVPFITPAYAFGKASESVPLIGSESGSALMLGGGLGIYNIATNVTVNVGAQHSFMNGARNLIGFNVVVGGK
jgi:hypothetical protein